MVKITLKNVTKQFGKVKAVDKLNLEIEDEEFLVLLGPSGCGKTTTLRMIAGLEKPTSGDLFFDDKPVTTLEPKERKVAMVFQDYALYPHMSVLDNITLCLQVSNVPAQEIKKRAQETAELLQISELMGRKPGQLSGGQRQRVALARAAIRKPSIYLLDEPLSNIDAILRIKMRGELKKLHERLKTTTVYVTHDQAEAMVLADRIAVMKDGLLYQIDKPLEIYDHPANKFVATFVGIPVMNFVDCQIQEKNGKSYVNADAFQMEITENSRIAMKGQQFTAHEAVMGIRPEHVYVSKAPSKNAVEAKVDLFQHFGDTGYATVEVGSSLITAKVDPLLRFEEGEKVFVKLNSERIHIFDKATEKTIF
ncbi:MAG: ABC transporter ATP-binding protein [Candidatus Bathyarchaeia archaeon]